MNEINPEIIKSVSDAVKDNLPETAKQTDGAISTVVGFFNNVVLYPVKKANLTFKYKLDRFEEDLKKKTQKIPEEYLQIPPTMMAGPILEALKYTYDEEELREMYENLLASAMDIRTVSRTHPSYVDAIKQMSPLDAQILSQIVDYQQLRCAKITFSIVGTNQEYINGMPNYFVVELASIADPFLISTALINLSRLGLITIVDGGLKGADYDSIKAERYVFDRFNQYKALGREIEIKLSKHAIVISDYGKSFAKVCLNKEI